LVTVTAAASKLVHAQLAQTQHHGSPVLQQQHQQWQIQAHTTATTAANMCSYNSISSGKSAPNNTNPLQA